MNETNIKYIRNYLKRNILNNKEFIGHKNERKEIFHLLQKTIQYGESNSALLIGPRGSGKTTVSDKITVKIYIFLQYYILVNRKRAGRDTK